MAHGVPMGIEEMRLVRDIELDDDGNVVIQLRLTSPTCHMVGYFDVEITDRVLGVPGVRTVVMRADHGLDWSPAMMSQEARQRRQSALQARGFPVPDRDPDTAPRHG